MIRSFGVEENQIASWAGLTGATFSFAQSLTAVPWGLASDRVGRKATIVMGLLSTMICFVLWGMSTSLAMAITVRFISGAGNGNVGIIRTMVAEMVTEREHQPRAFSIMPIVWSVGSVFGPAFGGFFARPTEQFPDVFGNSAFFKKYPFALPNLVLCVFFTISVITAILFLKETLESKRHDRDWGLKLGEKLTRPFRSHPSQTKRQHRPSFVDDDATAPLLPRRAVSPAEDADMQTSLSARLWEMCTFPQVINLFCYACLSGHAVAFDQLLSVFLNFPRQAPTSENSNLPFKFASGFGLRSDKIGTIFTINGLVCGIAQFFIFPTLCKRLGAVNCYRVAAFIFPFVYLATPYAALFPTDTLRYSFLLLMLLAKGFATTCAFPCMIIIITNSASSLSILGTLNGLATTTSGIGRTLGPAVTGAAFSWGVARGYIIVGWTLLSAISVVGAITACFITEGPGLPTGEPDSSEEDVFEDDDTVLGVEPADVGVGEPLLNAVPPIVPKSPVAANGHRRSSYGTIS